MKTIKYQQKAVKQLVEAVVDLLSYNGTRKKLIFQAPTGSGKTVMASEMLRVLNEELSTNPQSKVNEVAYIWIAPNKLHEQSYFKMKNVFTETRELKPVIYDELDHSVDGYIHPGEILFVNWESINKDNAIITRDTEQQASLYDMTDRTQQEHNIPIIVIIDEEHMFGGRQARKSEKVLQNINPKVEIRISATPLPESKAAAQEIVTVPRERVIEEQMIKEGVTLNPALEFNESMGSLNQHMMRLALQKRNELAEAYKALGVDINPLLLIQLPNDGEKMDKEDNAIKDEVLAYLEAKDITVKNGKMAIWLSGEKTDNLQTIAEPNDICEVLLFKQAIALGWDCPRAAVLLIFREIKSETFSAQTVGRILRMPEQHFYSDERLNRGYVYTNLSKDVIKIEPDDMDYLSKLYAKRRENLCNVLLPSVYSERPAAIRNRIGSDFKKVLIKTMEDNWGVNGKWQQGSLFTAGDFGEEEDNSGDQTNPAWKNREAAKGKANIVFVVRNVITGIIENVEVTGEAETIKVTDKAKYARTMMELEGMYLDFCARRLRGQWEKACIRILSNILKDVMEDLFELYESDAVKVILHNKNRDHFAEIIDKALGRYEKILAERQQKRNELAYKQYNWEVPADRFYNEESHHEVPEVKDHALMPFIELNTASSPEQRFTAFLEAHKDCVDWWYKNGDAGKQHYAVQYDAGGSKALFYVDFIIRMKNGQVLLFDTKSAGSDVFAPEKHNALYDYMHSEENKDKHLKGGIIIEDNGLWWYSPVKIDTTENHDGWDAFQPDDYKA